MGFLTDKGDEAKLIAEDRLQPVLVRCGSGRFFCPVQDLHHFVDIIKNSQQEYIRDISVYSK